MKEQQKSMSDLERAIEIALDAHAGERDQAGETYIRHPLRVMQAMDTETERIVAVLHDVVEDSPYTLADLEEEFNREVRDAVDRLTKKEDERTAMDSDEYYLNVFIPTAAENDIARKVKKADIRDNMDLSRLSEVSDDDLERIKKYHRALQKL